MGVFIVNYILYWCYKQESNLQLSPCKRDTRPLSYCSNLKWRGDQDLNLNLRFWKPLAYLQLSPRLLFYLNWMRKQESNLPNQAYETCQCPALFSALVLFYFTLIFWQNSLGLRFWRPFACQLATAMLFYLVEYVEFQLITYLLFYH